MFSDACKKVSSHIAPVIVSVSFLDGTVKCAGGALVILNDEGWVMTVAHLWELQAAFQHHQKERSEYEREVRSIEEHLNLTPKQKRKRIGKLKKNPKWITNHSFWWGRDGVELKDIKALEDADLVVGRLEPFDPKSVTAYPVIKDPSRNLDQGTSLCKLGFPFHEINATYDEQKHSFELARGTFPIPRFPIEGIYTRNLIQGKSKDGTHTIKFLETSSPGLRGQSGGPVFDAKGTIWGLQSRTHHLPLGFSPKVKRGGREVEENQFLNVGVAVHPELIVSFLQENKIKHQLSDY